MRRMAPLKQAEERRTTNEKPSEDINVTYSVLSAMLNEAGLLKSSWYLLNG